MTVRPFFTLLNLTLILTTLAGSTLARDVSREEYISKIPLFVSFTSVQTVDLGKEVDEQEVLTCLALVVHATIVQGVVSVINVTFDEMLFDSADLCTIQDGCHL